jgi:D-alanine-D-alanine ligase
VRVGLAFDLKSGFVRRPGDPSDAADEWDSEETVLRLEEAFRALGHEVVRLGGGREILRLSAGGPLPVDLVFNICEGRDGRSREAQVPAILELLEVPYTGSDPLTMAVSLDKGVAKRLLRDAGVPTPDFRVIASPAECDGLALAYPLFVKPLHEGTGKGIAADSLVRDPAALAVKVARVIEAYRQPALVETYLPGRELTVGILGNSPPEAIGTMEVVVLDEAEAGIYSAASKAAWRRKVRYIFNDAVGTDLRASAERTAVAAFEALGCRDFGRVDLRCDEAGRPCVLEVNPLAGLSPADSDLCFIAREAGLGHLDLVGRILEEACRRSGVGAAA